MSSKPDRAAPAPGSLAGDGDDAIADTPASEWVGAGLSPKQEQAVIALLNHPSIKQAAQACGIGERTLHTWLEQPAFSLAYRAARHRSFTHAVSLLQKYSPLAVHTLAKVMTDPAAPHAAKVAAALAVLRVGREGIEQDELIGRIESLEQALREQPSPLRLTGGPRRRR